MIHDFEQGKAAIARLHDMGIVVSIDDGGAGFTSLAYLGDLAFGELKLDSTFITRLSGSTGRDLAVVGATIALAHTQGLRVVAEGVEDRATLDLLIGVGCDLAQGYFIGRLVPAGDLATELTAVAPSLAVAELAAS